MAEDVTVSVVMPVYNGAGFLADAIRSIQDQTYADWELVVGDDGSTDRSLEICREFAARDRRIRVLGVEKNRGLAANMNLLVAAARGRYIAVQEQDDRSHPERLAKEVAALDGDPDAGLVSGVAAWIDGEGRTFAHFPGILHGGRSYPRRPAEMVEFLYVEQCKVVNAACMFRKELALRVPGPFDEGARMSIDWQFFLRLAHLCPFVGLRDVLVFMRRGGDHQSLTRQKRLQFAEARRCIRLMLDDYAGDRSSPINRRLYRRAMATQLNLEGRSRGGLAGMGSLLNALVYDPLHRPAWASLGQTGRRGLGKLVGASFGPPRRAGARP